MRSASVARAEGEATARALLAVGINVDLAPVAGVKRIAGSFLGPRSFGTHPANVAERAFAFARGLASDGVAFTLKHLPGLGRALVSTDVSSTVVRASAHQLRRDYDAYRRCGWRPRGMVMVSSAIYPTIARRARPAVLSPEIYRRELPLATDRHRPLTISDNLQTPALAGAGGVAVRAVRAGLDMLLYATSEAGAVAAYHGLLASVRSGELPRTDIRAASGAIVKFKLSVR